MFWRWMEALLFLGLGAGITAVWLGAAYLLRRTFKAAADFVRGRFAGRTAARGQDCAPEEKKERLVR